MDGKTLSRQEVINSKILIGVDIIKVKGIIGYWWVCTNNNVNCSTGKGLYVFERAGYGRLEVHTQYKQDNKGWNINEVVDVK